MTWDYSKLLGAIKEKYRTQDRFAKALGISRTSLSLRLNNKIEFSQNEIGKSLELLERDDVIDLFYTLKVQKDERKN